MKDAKKPSAKEAKAAERRIVQAKAALIVLTAAERAAVFHEMGMCACAKIARAAVKNPAVTLGGFLGALVAAAISAPENKTEPLAALRAQDPSKPSY